MKTLQIVTTTNHSFFNAQVAELRQNGIECDIITASLPRTKYERLGGPITGRLLPDWGHTVPYYALNALAAHPRILTRILQNEYDVIHANSGLTAPFALLQPEGPVVQTFWGSDLMGDYLYGQYDRVCTFCANRFDAAIVRNEAMKQKLDGDAHVIPAGVDMDLFKPQPQDEAQQEVDWSPDKRHILFPSAARPKSESMKAERKNYPLAKAVVDEANKQLDEDLVLQTVYGVDHDRIPTYMNAADVLILSSKLEGSPNTVKEALACNLPVVSTDVGDVRERLRGVEPSAVGTSKDELVEGLVEVIEYGGRSNGREQVRPLSWTQIGKQIVDVYETVV